MKKFSTGSLIVSMIFALGLGTLFSFQFENSLTLSQ